MGERLGIVVISADATATNRRPQQATPRHAAPVAPRKHREREAVLSANREHSLQRPRRQRVGALVGRARARRREHEQAHLWQSPIKLDAAERGRGIRPRQADDGDPRTARRRDCAD
eukprot:4573480-Prymnesium_polylepis.1